MKRLVYLSSADVSLEQPDLEDLILVARNRNQANQVTGLLFYNGYNFLQILEGAPDAVDAIFTSIKADKRHHGVVTMLEEEVGSRLFNDWSMRIKLVGHAAEELPSGSKSMDNLVEDIPQDIPPHILKLIEGFNSLKS